MSHPRSKPAALAIAAAAMAFTVGCNNDLGGQDGELAPECAHDLTVADKGGFDLASACGTIGGTLVVRGVDGADIDGLGGVREVRGDLVIEHNPSLASLDGLSGLQRVGRNLIVRGNTWLPRGEVDDLRFQLDDAGGVGGETTLSLSPLAEDGEEGDDDGEHTDDDPFGDDEEDPAEEDPVEDDPVDEDPIEEDPIEEDPVDEDPIEEDPIPDEDDVPDEDPTGCDGEEDCVLLALEDAVATLVDALDLVAAQVSDAANLAAAGDIDAALDALDDAFILGEDAGDALGDVVMTFLGALFSGVDIAVLGDAVSDAVDAMHDVLDAAEALAVALQDGDALGDLLGDCDDAVDDSGDANDVVLDVL